MGLGPCEFESRLRYHKEINVKKFITVLFCLTLLFGGVAGYATAATTDVITAVETQEIPKIVDFKFIVSKISSTATSCDNNQFSTFPWLVMAINSEGTEQFSDYAVIYDIDCKEYVLFYFSFSGPKVVNKFNSLEDVLTRLREELKEQQ